MKYFSPLWGQAELVTFDPDEPGTYPSVCQSSQEVRERFGFEGGETLLFDGRGKYIGQVVKGVEAQ